jgi:two-component system response regulator HupR/HoxA
MIARLPVVLVVDDEVRSVEALRRTLEEEANVLTATSAEEARALMEREAVEVVLCDQRMPGTSGVRFLRHVRERWPDVVRIILSGYTDTDDIIAGINEAGIYQFMLKPWQPEALLLAVRNAAQLYRLQQETQRLNLELRATEPALRVRVGAKREALRRRFDVSQIVRGPGSPMEAVAELLRRVAPHDIPILLQGESGTGKELLARAVHYNSPRAEGAFVVENCAALPDPLLESELFGHKRGAFTGAYEDRVGLLKQADGGTVFLDEIGDTSPQFQVKLLRVLQEGEIRPVGASRPVRIDVRVISATNRELEADVAAGRFRKDLYYRLAGFTLRVAPLRERPMDIPAIAEQVLQQAMRALGKRVVGFTAEAMACMKAYRWPGNVRELQNEVYRMLALCEGERVGAELLSRRILHAASPEDEPALQMLGRSEGTLKDRMEALEARVLKEALIRHRWNKTRAAAELGLSRVGLRGKLERYGLNGAAGEGRERGDE